MRLKQRKKKKGEQSQEREKSERERTICKEAPLRIVCAPGYLAVLLLLLLPLQLGSCVAVP
jgi:hypothetical protein